MSRAEEAILDRPLDEDVLIGERTPCALFIADASWISSAVRIAIVTNPRLADLDFQRVLDPYTCYQAIETFLGAQLAPPDLAPPRVGSNEVIARQKGFDDASFRTAAPGSKKQDRARNRARKRRESEP